MMFWIILAVVEIFLLIGIVHSEGHLIAENIHGSELSYVAFPIHFLFLICGKANLSNIGYRLQMILARKLIHERPTSLRRMMVSCDEGVDSCHGPTLAQTWYVPTPSYRPSFSGLTRRRFLVKQVFTSQLSLLYLFLSTLPVFLAGRMNSPWDIIPIYHVHHVQLLTFHVFQMDYPRKVVQLDILVIRMIRIVPLVEWANLVIWVLGNEILMENVKGNVVMVVSLPVKLILGKGLVG